MASGKLSPRQKMINLMYLIFIAMIAMQMTKEVLSAFGYMNEKLSANNITANSKNQAILTNLKTKSDEQPAKYGDKYATASKVNDLSKAFSDYLDVKKEYFLKDQEDRTNYEAMEKRDIVDEHFFLGDGFTPEGQEFLDHINGYRDQIVELIGEDHPLSANIKNRFNTDKQDTPDGKQLWLKNRYEGFPLISTVTNLTSMQTDIQSTQAEIYGSLLGVQLEQDAGIGESTYGTILIPDKPTFFQDENFKGKIVLGRYDASLQPDQVVVNGNEVKTLEKGAAILDFPAGAVGEREVKGKFVFVQDGEPVEIPISTSYMVIPKPNSAVISADKMNVVYRGVSNPMTISIPGISDNNVTATGTGLRKGTGIGKYVMTPGAGKEVKINVSGVLPDGTRVSSPPKTFRIKDIPAPQGSIRKQTGIVKMPKTSLGNATVGAVLPDFDFDLSLSTSAFTIKVPGQSAVVVRGNKMDAQAKKAINRAKRGDIIAIFDIKSSLVGNSSYKIKNASPVSIEIQ
jgi:gliding motility-associated protein GldM